MEKPTAAHRTFAFGTVVRVANQATGKTVDVRINDRGPFVAGRIIDLSHGAAQSISMPSTAEVRLQVLRVPSTRGVSNYAVQVGAFPTQAEAVALERKLQAQFGSASIIFRPGDRSWRVLAGMLPTVESANALEHQMEPQVGPGFVVMLDEESSQN